jgi:hypothetical protein
MKLLEGLRGPAELYGAASILLNQFAYLVRRPVLIALAVNCSTANEFQLKSCALSYPGAKPSDKEVALLINEMMDVIPKCYHRSQTGRAPISKVMLRY